jgi:multiple sugar transport system substrate-binding protein
MSRRRALVGTLALAASACARATPEARQAGPLQIVWKTQPLGDPGPLRRSLAEFERRHPGVTVRVEYLPNAPGAVHQYLLTSLEGGSADFDVFLTDVIWVAELARAGWLVDLQSAFPERVVRRDFLPGPADAVLVQGGTYAVPWYADVGIMYFRADLVPHAPRTFAEIPELVARGRSKSKAPIHGYVWQGLQSEALVCNAFEAIWGTGGIPESPDLIQLATPQAEAALAFLRSLITSGTSPSSVTSMAEEESRRVFQAGGAVLMRNWPYAWAECQSKGSPVRGRIATAPLPTASGAPGHGALGGFQLALAAHTPAYKREAAIALIEHLTSHESNLMLARDYARLPARRVVYGDERLIESAPFIASLLPAVIRALPRPVTPYYPMIDDTLAAEMSAAITGVRSPAEALARAQALANHLVAETT